MILVVVAVQHILLGQVIGEIHEVRPHGVIDTQDLIYRHAQTRDLQVHGVAQPGLLAGPGHIGQGVVNDLALEAVHLGHGLALVVSRHLNGVVAVLQKDGHRAVRGHGIGRFLAAAQVVPHIDLGIFAVDLKGEGCALLILPVVVGVVLAGPGQALDVGELLVQLLHGGLRRAVHMDDGLRGLAVEHARLVRQRHPEGGGALLQGDEVVEDIFVHLAVAAQALVGVEALHFPNLKDAGVVNFKAQPPGLIPGQARLAAQLGIRISNILKGHRIGVPSGAQGQVEPGSREHEVVQVVCGLADGAALASLILVQQLQRVLQHAVFLGRCAGPQGQCPALELFVQLAGGADGVGVLGIKLVRQRRGGLGDVGLILVHLCQHGISQVHTRLVLPLQLGPQSLQLDLGPVGKLGLYLVLALVIYLLGLAHRRLMLRVHEVLHLGQSLDHSLQLRSLDRVADDVEGVSHHIRAVLGVFNTDAEVCFLAAQLNAVFDIHKLGGQSCASHGFGRFEKYFVVHLNLHHGRGQQLYTCVSVGF